MRLCEQNIDVKTVNVSWTEWEQYGGMRPVLLFDRVSLLLCIVDSVFDRLSYSRNQRLIASDIKTHHIYYYYYYYY